MTTRLLPQAEWSRLDGTALACLAGQEVVSGEVVVVEDAKGAIVGCWSLLPLFHAEGLWVAPAHRGKVGVVRHLKRSMRRLADTHRLPVIVTGAMTPEVHVLLTHLHATALPGVQYLIPVEAL